jgi:signal transduction histidine kinase
MNGISYENAAWENHPWGMVAINLEGRVCAINPSFENCTNLVIAALIGLSEADFDQQLSNVQLLDRTRVEINDGSLRAIHYVRGAGRAEYDGKLSKVAELMREPLASIYGFAEMLLTQHYDDQTRRDLTAMLLGQAEVMANLINEQLENRASWTRATDNRQSGGE